MLYLFACHPLWWALPALATLVLWVLAARFLPDRCFRGEWRTLSVPGIIFAGSALWFVTVPFILAGLVFWLGAKAVGLLLNWRKR